MASFRNILVILLLIVIAVMNGITIHEHRRLIKHLNNSKPDEPLYKAIQQAFHANPVPLENFTVYNSRIMIQYSYNCLLSGVGVSILAVFLAIYIRKKPSNWFFYSLLVFCILTVLFLTLSSVHLILDYLSMISTVGMKEKNYKVIQYTSALLALLIGLISIYIGIIIYDNYKENQEIIEDRKKLTLVEKHIN